MFALIIYFFRDCHMQDNLKNQLVQRLQKQLEFYFEDCNLYKDKFLKNLLINSKYVDLSIFLNFNKIKEIIILGQEPLQMLRDAVKGSEILKLSKNEKQIKRIKKIEFNNKNIQDQIDKTTIYVENIPEFTNHQTIRQIFSKIGEVKLTSLPTYKNSKKCKGFAFVQFGSEEEVTQAVLKYNNCIPQEFTNDLEQKQMPLQIMTKIQWLQFKNQFKELKKEMNQQVQNVYSQGQKIGKVIYQESDQFIECNEKFTLGTLIKLYDIPEQIDKYSLKIAISQLCDPQYIDFLKKERQAIIRFKTTEEADFFFDTSNLDQLQQTKKQKLSDQEQKNYFEKIKKLKNNFREFNFQKKFEKKQQKVKEEEEYQQLKKKKL